MLRNSAGNSSAVVLTLPMLALLPMVMWVYPWLIVRKTARKVGA